MALGANNAFAQLDDSQKGKILSTIEEALKQKTIQSGTLDLYDENFDKVRNLRVLEKSDEIKEQDAGYMVAYQYRDINEGDIVYVEFHVKADGGDFSVQKIHLGKITKLNSGADDEQKEYSDEEIQAFMKDYIEKKTQFTDGKIMLYDEENEKMRNLALKEISPEVRRMGIFYSSGSQFVDADSGEILKIDISTENRDGKLSVQALRIRDVFKPPFGE